MKSIKQIADENHVSKETIRKYIVNLGLRNELQKVGNKFVVPENVELLILKAFNNKSPNNSTTNTQTNTQTDIVVIESLLEQIKELHQLLDQQQKITFALQQEKQLLIESQSKKSWFSRFKKND